MDAERGAHGFHATEAAFAGFALMRREPLALLAWGAVRFVFSLILAIALIVYGADKVSAFMAAIEQGSVGMFADAMVAILPYFALVVPISLLQHGVLIAAVYRAFLRPEERRAGYVRLGRDELRMVAVTVLWQLLLLGLSMVTLAVVSVVVEQAGNIGGLAVLLGFLVVAAFVVATVWGLVRMSLAWAVSFDQERVSLFRTWRLTKGHFWTVLAAYALAVVVLVVLTVLANGLFSILAWLATGEMGAAGRVWLPDASSVSAYLSPLMIAWLAFDALVSAAGYAVVIGPTAEAYREFGEGRAVEAAA